MTSPMTYITAVPAYGRDYKTAAEVKAAWAEGKDFRCTGRSTYINKQDADTYGVSVEICFAGGRRITVINPTKGSYP